MSFKNQSEIDIFKQMKTKKIHHLLTCSIRNFIGSSLGEHDNKQKLRISEKKELHQKQ